MDLTPSDLYRLICMICTHAPMRLTLAAALLIIALPSQATTSFTRTQILMGNVPVSITIKAPERKKGKAFQAMEKAFDEARRIESEVSEWRPQSQTTLLNRNAGKKWVPIGQDLREILLLARQISEETDGAFDLTFASRKSIAPRTGQAGCFGAKSGERPSSPEPPSPSPNFSDVLLDTTSSRAKLRTPRVKIGVSGIAKGYIIDKMSDILKKEGFRKFLVNAGDIYAAGRWEIGIRDPMEKDKTVCTITVKDRAVSTSGLYERGPHIINPTTGRPVRNPDLLSVTVVAKSSAVADARATGLFVMGREKAAERMRSHRVNEACTFGHGGRINVQRD